MEGGLTCAIAVAGFYMIPDFPTTPASWLTDEEQMLAQRRMVEDLHGVEKRAMQKSGLVEAFSDWTVWWLGLSKAVLTVGLSFGNYFPTLAATMGYSPSVSLLLCTPPWILGVVSSFVISRFVLWLFLFLLSLDSLQALRCYKGPLLACYWPNLRWYNRFCDRNVDNEHRCSLLISVS